MKIGKKPYLLPALLLLGAVSLFCLPRDLFKGVPLSTVVEDRDGRLIGARIAADGQWRFPAADSIPPRYALSVIHFEDRHFYFHPGVDPLAIARALRSNLRSGHVQSGGSTLTMQVIRLSRQRERTLWQKGIEALLALHLELRCSKREILSLYASYAPFGGNVVGVEAAAWRYFGRSPFELSWAESATLAILPNAPSSMHPGKGRDALLRKRNRLLKRMWERHCFDDQTYRDALQEPLPDAPHPLPSYARQLVDAAPKGVRTRTGIDLSLQLQIEALTKRWGDEWALSGSRDLAAIVIDISSGEPLAYVGNASPERKRPGSEVDIIRAPRSSGSILKPFLYAMALQEGTILPGTLLKDTPVNMGGFSPQNFDQHFSGAVPAREALSRSLNVPAVHLLREVGVPRFHALLCRLGLTTLTRQPDHYGLSLILGGGECRLGEVTAAYAGMVRSYLGLEKDFPLSDRLAIYHTLEALKTVRRPDELDARLIPSIRQCAWKTGTSYGFRDAWAVGVTPRVAIGVWCGNADGSGVPELLGARTAGPVLFDILNLLPLSEEWFPSPGEQEGVILDVCTRSGQLKGRACDQWEPTQLPEAALRSEVCPYHREVGGRSVFRLPPAMEWYYRSLHPDYDPAPGEDDDAPIEFIYPERGSILFLSRQLDGTKGGVVFQAAHRRQDARLWWHLDQSYVGETVLLHQLQLAPSPGPHSLTVVDEQGNSLSVSFTISE